MKTAPSTTWQDEKKHLRGGYLKTVVLQTFAIVFFSSAIRQDASEEHGLATLHSAPISGEAQVAFTSRYLRINEYLFHGKELAKALV